MPELPEVETVVSDLRRKVVGGRIVAVWCNWPKMIKDYARQSRLYVSLEATRRFKVDLLGESIEKVARRGKNILIYLSSDKVLLIHQKMTGHLLIGKWRIGKHTVVPLEPEAVVRDSYNHHIHLILTLSDGRMIALSDVRKFAKVILGSREQIETLPELTGLGPDALHSPLSAAEFFNILSKQRRKIKTVLLDPRVVAGIGNIYSDDILWQARIHPERPAHDLSRAEVTRIYKAMRTILAKAVALRGTSTSDFRDTEGKEGGYTEYRLVYQRTGSPCSRCKTPINRRVVGGRSAHFCPNCQRFLR